MLTCLSGCGDVRLDPLRSASLDSLQRLDMGHLDDVRALMHGHAPGELADVYVKATFPVHRRGVRYECMWVQVVHWRDEALEGILVNAPARRGDLQAGSYVRLERDRIVDYRVRMPDGSIRGNALQSLLDGELGLVPVTFRPQAATPNTPLVPAPGPP